MRIKVGYADYTVASLAPGVADVADIYGYCDPHTLTIYVRPDCSPQEQGCTLIHELIHAAFDVFRLPKTGMTEEDVASRLEVPLATIFRDNPKLLGVIQKALSEGKPIV